MAKNVDQNKLTEHSVRRAFDQTVIQHMERLIGTSQGIGNLPLNMVSISCLVLLAERESDIEASPSAPPERYTKEAFLEELIEIALDPGDDLQATLQDMIQKEYIEVTPDGTFLAKKPAISTVQLLDHLFPAMPGMNLVAYFVQIMDEVLSERKDLVSGIRQLDETLHMHGVLLSKQTQECRVSRQHSSSKATKVLESAEATRQTLSEILRKRQAQRMSQRSPEPAGEPRILTATGSVRQREFEIKEVYAKGDRPAATTEVPPEEQEVQGQELPEEGFLEAGKEESPLEAVSREDEGPYADSGTLEQHTAQPDSDLLAEEPSTADTVEDAAHEKDLSTEAQPDESGTKAEEESSPARAHEEEEIVSKEQDVVAGDESIEVRIAAFEEGLAMTCPLCGTGRVQKEQTEKGKHFYVCSNKDCIFISWGKPYHIVCPQCKNPFLIESTDRDGKTIFRCPRATCHHRQKPPWEMSTEPQEGPVPSPQERLPSKKRVLVRKPRKKVVRRRLVRRKR